jgi:hypothetical protein
MLLGYAALADLSLFSAAQIDEFLFVIIARAYASS